MATSAAALRNKLFPAGPVVTAPANTEGLRQATDALLRQQASAEATVGLYRTKLGEAQEAVAKLQAAYVEQAQLNGRLQGERGEAPQALGGPTDSAANRRRAPALSNRLPPPALPPRPAAKVKNDHETLAKLQTAVNTTFAAYARLNAERVALAEELATAEEQRAALAGAFTAKAAAQASLEQALAAACEAGKELQGRLDAAAAVHAMMTADLATARADASDKVSAPLGRCGGGCYHCQLCGCWCHCQHTQFGAQCFQAAPETSTLDRPAPISPMHCLHPLPAQLFPAHLHPALPRRPRSWRPPSGARHSWTPTCPQCARSGTA